MNTKTTLVLALVAVVCAGYLFLVELRESPQADAKKDADSVAKALFDPKPESKDVDRVELTTRGDKFVLVKRDNAWTMVEPLEAGANEVEVNSLLDRAADVKYVQKYEKGDKDRPSEATTGLDKPQATVKLLKGDKVQAELLVGSRLPVGKGTYVARAGSDTVYEAQTDLSGTFNKRLDALRDKRVLKFELKDVQRVRVEGLQNYELVHSGDNWVIESPTRGRAEKDRADRVVRPLTTLSAQDWKDDKPVSLRPYGLDRPRLKVTMDTTRQVPAKFKEGDPGATRPADTQPSTEQQTYALLIGGATDDSGSAFFAKLESSPAVFTLTQYTVNELSPPLTDLRDKTVAKIDAANNVSKIEIATPEGEFALNKNDKGEWTFADGRSADAAAVDDLVRAVQGLKATDFADPRDPLTQFDWSKARAKVTLTRRGELKPLTVLVGRPSASGKMVYVRNADEEAVAVVRDSEAEQLLAPAVAYQDRSVLKLAQDRASKIEITRVGGEVVTLEKANNQWKMTAPVAAAADSEATRNLLQDLAVLRAKRVVGSGDKAKYGLDKPEVRLAVWVPPLTANPNTKVVGATQPATTRPAATQPSASTQPAGKKPTLKELLEYQKTLPNANPLATKMLEDLIAKEEAAAATQPAATRPAIEDYLAHQKANPNANPKMTEALEQMISDRGKATQPAAATQPASTEPTVYRLAVHRKDGVTYAAVEDQPTVYELDGKIYEDAIAEMHDRQVLKFEPNNVTDVTFESSDARIVLRKSGEEWKYMPDPVLPIDKQKVTDVLNAFRDLKTHDYVSYKAEDLGKYGLDQAFDRMAVTVQGGETTEILLSKRGPEGDADKSRYATVAGTKKVFLLKDDQASKFAQKLEDFERKNAAPGSPGAPGAPGPAVSADPFGG